MDTHFYFIADYTVTPPQYVSAPVGYFQKKDGSLVKDGTPSPEITFKPIKAWLFRSHRSAARTLSKLGPSWAIVEIHTEKQKEHLKTPLAKL